MYIFVLEIDDYHLPNLIFPNPCPAKPYVYIRFQACFRSIEILLNLIHEIVFGRCLVNPILQYWRCKFFINHKCRCYSSFEAEASDE